MKTVSIHEAAEHLEFLAALALQGEPVLIEKDSKLLVLQELPSIPVAPPGFFDDVYDEEYIREANLTEPRSVISPDP